MSIYHFDAHNPAALVRSPGTMAEYKGRVLPLLREARSVIAYNTASYICHALAIATHRAPALDLWALGEATRLVQEAIVSDGEEPEKATFFSWARRNGHNPAQYDAHTPSGRQLRLDWLSLAINTIKEWT